MKLNNFFSFLILFLIFVLACTPQVQTAASSVQPQDRVRNVESQSVNYGPATGFLAQPKEKGDYPAVVMIHEWWGLNDNIKEMAKQLSAEGYVVLAVDLFQGKVAKNSSEAGQFTGAVRSNPNEAIHNMKAAATFLKNLDNVNKELIASMGWCFGGGMSL